MHLDVRIQRLADADKPAFPELNRRPMKEIEVSGCTILEGGTVAGGPSLIFHGFEGELVVMFQISGTILDIVHATLVGAAKNWKDNPQ